jgi:large subunit ribosomal protein L9
MKVILIENIDKIGSKGDVINVKRGFARNYLIPRNYAIYSTPQNLKNLESLKKQYADEESKRLEILKKLGEQISKLNLSFVRKVDEHDNLYGSVSEMDILHELKENNIDIPKTAIVMDKHVKNLGDFEIQIRLHKEVLVNLRGSVVKEETEKPVEELVVAETIPVNDEPTITEEVPEVLPEVVSEDNSIPEVESETSEELTKEEVTE